MKKMREESNKVSSMFEDPDLEFIDMEDMGREKEDLSIEEKEKSNVIISIVLIIIFISFLTVASIIK